MITNAGWARFFCRVMLGTIFLMAGLYKCAEMTPLGHAERFFTEPYADTWIPHYLLLITGVMIPIVELAAGALLIVGWRTREALVAIGFILLTVTYGHLLKEALFSITAHIFPRTALMVATLLLPSEDDRLSLDSYWVTVGRRQGE